MQIYYLEIVTADVEATCELYAKLHRNTTWSDPDPSLGGARTAKTTDGSLIIGVRAPMHAGEKAVTRAYTTPWWKTSGQPWSLSSRRQEPRLPSHPRRFPGVAGVPFTFSAASKRGFGNCEGSMLAPLLYTHTP